jgi:hypothetical protein
VIQELRRRLWRWTARHPEWEPGEPDSPADWPPDVGCVADESADALAFIDPLVPDNLWQTVDELVERRRRPVAVLTTIGFHRRSRDAFVARYGASILGPAARQRPRGLFGGIASDAAGAKKALPQGVETIPIRGAGETMIWIAEHRALVPGDRILGFGANGTLRVCPDSWLRYLPSGMTGTELRDSLRPLLELPIEMVLVSHGKPVLKNGREALARAIAD